MHASEAHVIIIGGGIAGASIGYWLALHARVILIEREAQPGYHSTGRSAAMFIEGYGTPQVRALTMASRAFLESPPPGFTDHPLLSRRGELIVAAAGQQSLLARHEAIVRRVNQRGERLDADGACALVPVLKRDAVVGAVFEPDAADIDVHALHHGYLRGLRRAGGEVVCNAEATDLRRDGDHWHVMAAGRSYRAPIVVNAAGAWGDVVGRRAGLRPIGLQPKRRTAFVFAPPAGHDIAHWPAVIAADESWYVKPDAGQLLGSPANTDPVEPHDVQAEELDVARGIHRIEAMTTLAIRRPARVWAGLRSFVRDGDLVGGFDPDGPGFFWLVAQGGYGIQTSAAMGEACAALVLGEPLAQWIADFGLTAAMLSPRRLQQAKA